MAAGRLRRQLSVSFKWQDLGVQERSQKIRYFQANGVTSRLISEPYLFGTGASQDTISDSK